MLDITPCQGIARTLVGDPTRISGTGDVGVISQLTAPCCVLSASRFGRSDGARMDVVREVIAAAGARTLAFVGGVANVDGDRVASVQAGRTAAAMMPRRSSVMSTGRSHGGDGLELAVFGPRSTEKLVPSRS